MGVELGETNLCQNMLSRGFHEFQKRATLEIYDFFSAHTSDLLINFPGLSFQYFTSSSTLLWRLYTTYAMTNEMMAWVGNRAVYVNVADI